MKKNISLHILIYLKSIFYQEEEEYEGDMSISDSIDFSHQVLYQQDENFLNFKQIPTEQYNKVMNTLKKDAIIEKKKLDKTTINF